MAGKAFLEEMVPEPSPKGRNQVRNWRWTF